MANTRSAWKRVRSSAKRRERNRSTKSRVRTLVRHFETTVAGGDTAAAEARFAAAASALDKAVAKGILHKNTAARKKSRMAARLNAALKQAGTAAV